MPQQTIRPTTHPPTSMGIHGSERCSRPLSRSQTTTPHHAPPVPIQEQADAAGYPRPPHRPKPMQASWSEAPNHFSTRDTPRHLVDNIDQTRAVHPDGGGSDSSEPQQCVCLEPRNGVTGSCRHPPRAPPSLTPGALAGGPERAGGVVCFHIFQRHHQRQDTNGPGLGVCSLERR